MGLISKIFHPPEHDKIIHHTFSNHATDSGLNKTSKSDHLAFLQTVFLAWTAQPSKAEDETRFEQFSGLHSLQTKTQFHSRHYPSRPWWLGSKLRCTYQGISSSSPVCVLSKRKHNSKPVTILPVLDALRKFALRQVHPCFWGVLNALPYAEINE